MRRKASAPASRHSAERSIPEVITTGTVVGDTLMVADWDGYGIGRIFVESGAALRSEVPLVEVLNRVEFIRPQGGG